MAELSRALVELVAKLAPALVLRLRRLLGDRLRETAALSCSPVVPAPCRSSDLPCTSSSLDGFIRVPRVCKRKHALG